MQISRIPRATVPAAVLLVAAGASLGAQRADSTRADSARAALPPIVVTATRTPKTTFDAPTPVTYIGGDAARERLPNSIADLFRDVPGLDVDGVGTNQVRPAIRGQRGQRILLLEDGVRMNNSRREQDFGELPALVPLTDVDRIEVVRGSASVLYGTDAIAGVVNIITRDVPDYRDRAIHGAASYRYGSADVQRTPSATIEQRLGRFHYRLSGTTRESNAYTAPTGSYGDVTFTSRQRVNDTGVHDAAYGGLFGYDFGAHQRVVAKYERYSARDAGFGYVDPAVLGPDEPLIRIQYPDQRVDKYSVRYDANALATPFADRLSVIGYTSNNARHLAMNIFVPFGPGTPPGAGMNAVTANFTALSTIGMRAEATKAFARHLVTYGVDAFRDRSDNTDSSVTTIVGFGPPQSSTSTATQVPNASFSSAGAFVEGDFRMSDRLSLLLGTRAQDVRARTRPTMGAATTSTDRTIVGTANALYRVTNGLNLVASLGRGFRSPNLVERFFDGPTPEGSGYQRANPNLQPETSVDANLGARYRNRALSAEAFVFRNMLHDGIRIAATGDSVQHVPAFQNVNVDRLRFQGAEASAEARIAGSLVARGSYTHVEARDVRNPSNPAGTGYATKTVGELTYQPSRATWVGYVVRHNGRQTSAQIGTNPVGTTLPPFTVHGVRAGARLLDHAGVRGTIIVGIDNLANTLYAETSNASFFRPQPGRNVSASWTLEF